MKWTTGVHSLQNSWKYWQSIHWNWSIYPVLFRHKLCIEHTIWLFHWKHILTNITKKNQYKNKSSLFYINMKSLPQDHDDLELYINSLKFKFTQGSDSEMKSLFINAEGDTFNYLGCRFIRPACHFIAKSSSENTCIKLTYHVSCTIYPIGDVVGFVGNITYNVSQNLEFLNAMWATGSM